MRCWLAASIVTAAAGAAAAQGDVVPLQDSAQGMTCQYHTAIARMAWSAPGGDWKDAAGQWRGADPISQSRVAGSRAPQRVSWPAEALVRRWVVPGNLPGAVLVRSQGGGSMIDFASRESPLTVDRPLLRVVWDDGQVERLEPTADSHLSCPAYRSSGTAPLLQVGGNIVTMLVFPFKPRAAHQVTTATLELTSLLARGKGAMVGLYEGALPAAPPASAPGLAARVPRDDALAALPDVLIIEGFEGSDWRRRWPSFDETPDVAAVTTDAENRFVPLQGQALRVILKRGHSQALNVHLPLRRSDGSEPEEAYFRYYLRLGDSWNPDVDGGKLPGLAGTYGKGGWGRRKSDGQNGWSTRGAFFEYVDDGTPLAQRRAVGSYVYHAAMSNATGDSWGWNMGSTGLLQKNRWYCVEQQVRLNRPGSDDGVLRAWIDGQLVFERRGLRFREVSELKIESVWFNVYHGGTKPASRDMTLFIDNVVVARQYIGPRALPR
jgi:hypothetical protein